MGSEKNLWAYLYKGMQEYWIAERIESVSTEGIPDVYFTKSTKCAGWIELKHVASWPKRASTPIRLQHYTPFQKAFIRRHGRVGNHIYLLLQIERSYFLFNWQEALKVGQLTKNMLYKKSFNWEKAINFKVFNKLLCEDICF